MHEAQGPESSSFCLHCHNLDLRSPALAEELPAAAIEKGLWIQYVPDEDGDQPAALNVGFTILGDDLRPGAARLAECPYCALISAVISTLHPVLSVSLEWKLVVVEIWLERGENVVIRVLNWSPGGDHSFELYVTGGDQYPFWGQGRESEDLEPFTGSERTFQLLNEWLSRCSKIHSKCRHKRLDWNPTRLIQVDDDAIRLIVTKYKADRHLRYAALSHCWGTHQPLRTLKANIETHKAGIDPSSLPRVFQDSVAVTRKLGISYLWIDSLCIIQDDLDDWAGESRVMDKVYAQAFITISATGCHDCTVPMLTSATSSGTRTGPMRYKPDNKQPSLEVIKARILPDSTEFVGPLMERAWALQERYFSSRIIHFEQQETRWQCKEERGQESKQNMSPLVSSEVHRNPWVMWQIVLRQFTELSLTRFSDKLPASSGIAASFADIIGSEYVAGLWKSRLVQQLGWDKSYIMSPNRRVSGPFLEPEASSHLTYNQPPSWSWASVTGQVSCSSDHAEWTDLVTVKELSCHTCTRNKFGEVASGAFVRLEGRLLRGRLESRSDSENATDKYSVSLYGCRDEFESTMINPDCTLTSRGLARCEQLQWASRWRADEDLDRSSWSAEIALLPIGRYRDRSYRRMRTPCLVLGKGIKFDLDVYQRIGKIDLLPETLWEAAALEALTQELKMV